jgi:hypothetical protein
MDQHVESRYGAVGEYRAVARDAGDAKAGGL